MTPTRSTEPGSTGPSHVIKPLLAFAISAALALGAISPVLAQSEAETRAQIARVKPKDFPNQPLEFTVVYPAGGGMDVNGRLVAKYFEKWTGDKAIVNNRVGGAGMVGHTYLAAQAPKDGYTIGVVANLLFADSMLRAQGRWTFNDFEPVAYLNSDPLSFVTLNDGPYKGQSFQQLVQTAKDKPNTVRIATVPSSFFEYVVEQVEAASGARFLKVPFQGGAPGIAALLGSNVDIALAFFAEVRGHIEANKMSGIVVTSAERSPNFPNTPTINEVLGTKDIVWQATRWVAVPKGLPADRKAYLVAALTAAVRDPELQAEFRKMGAATRPDLNTPEKIAEVLNRLATLEGDFYRKTGRLK